MDLEFLKWIVVGLLGVATYFLKRTVDQMDNALKDHKTAHATLSVDVQNIKNEYLHKNDFREFKMELWSRFDDLKKDIRDRMDVK
jgi:hypothetical protein